VFEGILTLFQGKCFDYRIIISGGVHDKYTLHTEIGNWRGQKSGIDRLPPTLGATVASKFGPELKY